jgi:hypothetical protein
MYHHSNVRGKSLEDLHQEIKEDLAKLSWEKQEQENRIRDRLNEIYRENEEAIEEAYQLWKVG